MFFLLVFNLSKDSLVIGYLVTFSNIFILPKFYLFILQKSTKVFNDVLPEPALHIKYLKL